jgi:RNA polymerase sigma-70 factor (ECF subfamily)
MEGLPEYQARGYPFQAWLYRIARARTVDYFRRQERRREVTLEETLPAERPHPEQIVEMADQWGRAIDLVAQLTDDQQDVLILRFIGELTLSEVAETLGKTTGSVKSLQHRALSSLARLLDEQTAAGVHDA